MGVENEKISELELSIKLSALARHAKTLAVTIGMENTTRVSQRVGLAFDTLVKDVLLGKKE